MRLILTVILNIKIMDATEKVIEKKEVVHEDHKRNYATKGEALGIGIPALVLGGMSALALWSKGGLTPGGGSESSPANVNINTSTGGGVAPSAFDVYAHDCEESLRLTNEMWRLKMNTMERAAEARNTDVAEKFSLWKGQVESDVSLWRSQIQGDFENYKTSRDLYDAMNDKLNNAAFGLYKNQRDGFDVLSGRIGQLEQKVAVNEAIRPYQDKLLQKGIEEAYMAGVNYTDRKTCRMITGQLVLPNSPEVTGYGSYCCGQGGGSSTSGGGSAA